MAARRDANYLREMELAHGAITVLMASRNVPNVTLLKLALKDSTTFNHITRTGGANGSVRFGIRDESLFGRGLDLCDFVRDHCAPNLSYADLIQVGGAAAMENIGVKNGIQNRIIKVKPGRSDAVFGVVEHNYIIHDIEEGAHENDQIEGVGVESYLRTGLSQSEVELLNAGLNLMEAGPGEEDVHRMRFNDFLPQKYNNVDMEKFWVDFKAVHLKLSEFGLVKEKPNLLGLLLTSLKVAFSVVTVGVGAVQISLITLVIYFLYTRQDSVLSFMSFIKTIQSIYAYWRKVMSWFGRN